MSFVYAGQWGPDSITGAGGAPLPNDTVTVYESDGVTLATLYTDRTMGSTTPNPTTADLYGNLSIFAVPGQYVLSGNGGTLNITVPVDPADVGTSGGAVSSVFGRTGVVAAQSGDYTVSEVTGAAPLASPALTGTPTAPTASALTDSTQLATTAYADTAVGVETARAEAAEALNAPLASPALTGNPTAPTQTSSDNSTKIATTAFVQENVGGGGPPSGSASGDLSGSYPGPTVAKINGTALSGLATGILKNTTSTGVPSIAAAGTDYLAPSGNGSALTGITQSQVSGSAPLASPTFTGTPAAPTPSALDNSTKLATTAYADALRTAVQTLTNKTLTSPAVTGMSGTETNVTPINNAVSVTTNAGTVPVTSKLSTFTNSSAAAMTITIATASAVDGQPLIVRIYDFSAVAETITFVNCESSNVSLPAQSNGSTTLPLTVQFMYNSATSKWRCMGWA